MSYNRFLHIFPGYNSFLYIFPGQCAKYLHDKFKMKSELTVGELMVILKRMGIKTVKVSSNRTVYDVFYKREIDGIQDFEFLNNLHDYRRDKQIRDEWNKEAPENYDPELSNMQNASDELLRQDDVYYTNESKMMKYNNMKRNSKKALYESIMTSVAKEVKKTLNEKEIQDNKPALEDLLFDIMKKVNNGEIVVRDQQNMTDAIYFIESALSTDKKLNADKVNLYAGQFYDGILSYKDKKIKISKLDSKIANIFFSYWKKGQNVKNTFLINNEEAPEELRFYWVDKDGIEHNTKDEWIKNAICVMDDQGNEVIGIEWKKINIKDTIIGYIKKWYELTI